MARAPSGVPWTPPLTASPAVSPRSSAPPRGPIALNLDLVLREADRAGVAGRDASLKVVGTTLDLEQKSCHRSETRDNFSDDL